MIIQQDVSQSLAKLVPGSQVFVDIRTPAGQNTKFKTTYIGLLPGRFILLQMPDLSKQPKLPGFIQDKAACTIRGLIEGHEGAVLAFVSKFSGTIVSPTKMLVLAVPQELQLQQLRKVSRIETHINITTQIKNHPWSGIILDLTAQGCLLTFDKVPELQIDDKELLSLEVIDKNFGKLEPIIGIVCNVKKQVRTIEVGIEFDGKCAQTVNQVLQQILFA